MVTRYRKILRVNILNLNLLIDNVVAAQNKNIPILILVKMTGNCSSQLSVSVNGWLSKITLRMSQIEVHSISPVFADEIVDFFNSDFAKVVAFLLSPINPLFNNSVLLLRTNRSVSHSLD